MFYGKDGYEGADKRAEEKDKVQDSIDHLALEYHQQLIDDGSFISSVFTPDQCSEDEWIVELEEDPEYQKLLVAVARTTDDESSTKALAARANLTRWQWLQNCARKQLEWEYANYRED